MLDWVALLGGNQVSLYAFSIENFKRPPEEVDGLMKLFRGQLKSWLNERFHVIKRSGIRFRLWGDVQLLPTDIQMLAAKLTLATQSHDKFTLNIVAPYTSRCEIANAAAILRDSCEKKVINKE